MYNNDRKQEYIAKEAELRKLENVEKRCNWAFNKVEPYEIKYRKDASEFSYEEILGMYKDVRLGLFSLFDLHSALKRYALESIGSGNKYLLFTQGDLKKYFVNEKRVLLSQRAVLDFTDDLLNPMDKFCVYGLFCGVKGKEYCELNYSSMDDADEIEKTIWLADLEEDGSINLKGRKFYADQTLYKFAKDASEAVYMIQHTKEGVYKRIILEQDTKTIFKAPFNPSDKNSVIDNAIRVTQRFNRTILSGLGLSGLITPIDFYWSGLIFSIQSKALSHGKMLKTLDDYLSFFNVDKCEDIQVQYNIDLSARRLKAKLERYL